MKNNDLFSCFDDVKVLLFGILIVYIIFLCHSFFIFLINFNLYNSLQLYITSNSLCYSRSIPFNFSIYPIFFLLDISTQFMCSTSEFNQILRFEFLTLFLYMLSIIKSSIIRQFYRGVWVPIKPDYNQENFVKGDMS